MQQQRRRRALEQLAVARLARRHRALRADLLGDVARDAPVADEHSRFVEARLAADARDAQAPVGVAAPRQQAGERPVRFEVGAVLVELRLGQADVGHLPGRAADLILQQRVGDRVARRGEVGEAELAVLLPELVGGDAEQRAPAQLAFVLDLEAAPPQRPGEDPSAERGEADEHGGQLDPLAGGPGPRQQQQRGRRGARRRAGPHHARQRDAGQRRRWRIGTGRAEGRYRHAEPARVPGVGPGAMGEARRVAAMVRPARRSRSAPKRRSAN